RVGRGARGRVTRRSEPSVNARRDIRTVAPTENDQATTHARRRTGRGDCRALEEMVLRTPRRVRSADPGGLPNERRLQEVGERQAPRLGVLGAEEGDGGIDMVAVRARTVPLW